MIMPVSWSLIGGAALAGLIGSPHCLSMCGGFAASVAVPTGGGLHRASTNGGVLAWHAGRLTTYAALGAIVASIGGMLPGTGLWAGAVALGLLGWFSLRLAGVSLSVPGGAAWLHRLVAPVARLGGRAGRTQGLGGRFLFGMATGLLPCGLVWSALAMPMASGEPLAGALTMVVFGAGTVPALAAAAVGLRKLGGASLGVRRLLAAGVFAAGAWSIVLRTDVIGTLAGEPATGEPACHHAG